MKKSYLLLGFLFVIAVAMDYSVVMAHENMGKMDMESSWQSKHLTGEIIDLGCYVSHDATGIDHLGMKDCALTCAKAGAPLAFLELKTKKIYIIVTSGHGKNPYAEIMDYVGKKVNIVGAVKPKGGIHSLMIVSINNA